MNIHELKCWPEFFKPIREGLKTFEIRKNDRGFQVGDRLVLREFRPCSDCRGTARVWSVGDMDPCGCSEPHGRFTGQRVTVQVTYMTDFRQPDHQVVMGIEPDLR